MGKVANKISERVRHTQIKNGYCLICSCYGKLTVDHVPPQGAITISPVEQKHIMETMGVDREFISGIKSNNGSKFKTICQNCNNKILGKDDIEVAKVNKELTALVKSYFSNMNHIYPFITMEFNPIPYCRATIGHILAATTSRECIIQPVESPYFTPLQNFVLGDDNAINETHDIYYWFYPFGDSLSAKFVAFYNEGHHSISSLLSYFPIAFLITLKNKGTYPANANKLSLSDKKLALNMSTQNIEFSRFPFHKLRGNQFLMLNGAQAIVSTPIKN